MDEFMADNAATDEIIETPADQATDTQDLLPVETDAVGMDDGAAAEDGAAAVEMDDTREVTRSFSKRLNEMVSQREREIFEGLGLTNEYTGETIRSQQDYSRYLNMQQTSKSGQDPVVAERMSAMESELSRYRIAEQDEALSKDPERGEAYKALRHDVMALVDFCQQNGKPEVDVESAFGVVLRQNLGKLMNTTKTKTQQQAVRQMTANAAASPGALGAGETPKPMSYASMSDADFEKQLQLALDGKLKKS